MAAVKPNLIGHGMGAIVSFGDMSSVDGPSTVATANGLGQRNPVGFRVFDDAGNEYVYLPGVASLAQGDFVIYNLMPGAVTVARMLNDANSGGAGLVACAMGAFVASCCGWYQIFGVTPTFANVATTSSVLAALYRSATTGRLAASANAKDTVYGAFTAAASTSNAGAALLSYPFVVDQSTL